MRLLLLIIYLCCSPSLQAAMPNFQGQALTAQSVASIECAPHIERGGYISSTSLRDGNVELELFSGAIRPTVERYPQKSETESIFSIRNLSPTILHVFGKLQICQKNKCTPLRRAYISNFCAPEMLAYERRMPVETDPLDSKIESSEGCLKLIFDPVEFDAFEIRGIRVEGGGDLCSIDIKFGPVDVGSK